MSVAFSSRDDEVISRKLVVERDKICRSTFQIDEFYEINRSAKWIRAGGFRRVALQFPDNLLQDAAKVAELLEGETGCQMYISGDTSYGSCCVDEITAEHVLCDAIIHYGHACLSPTNRLPVLYVFGKLPFDADSATTGFKDMFQDAESPVIIFYEVYYFYAMDEFREALEKDYKKVVFSQLLLPSDKSFSYEEEDTVFQKCGRVFKIDRSQTLSSYRMFYIGLENQTLMNLMLTFHSNQFWSYNPLTRNCRQETLNVNKYIRKRYYYIEKAKDANIIGILVGTLGVSKYLEVINHLKQLIRQAGKKSYTLSVGKLNSAKLANFAEIEVFVCVACPECSLVDSHEFYQPIVTPFEMEVALNNAREWTGCYITDFRELLPGAAAYIPSDTFCGDSGDVSLVTGKMRVTSDPGQYSHSNNEIIIRNEMTVANISVGGSSTRTWKGLEQRLGETPVAEISQGRKGIASVYEDESEIFHSK